MKFGYQTAFKWTAIALASAVLFGCGGADNTTDETPTATVAVKETATGLSVKMTPSDGSGVTSGHFQAALYTFAAKVDAGTDAGQTLDGTLILKSVLQADGTTTLEGKLVAGKLTAAPATPSDAVVALQTEFATQLDALKTAYKTDVEALQATLKTALDAAATPNTGRRLNDAQKAALKTFSDAVKARTQQFQTDVTALVTDYRDKVTAAGGDATTIGLQKPGGHHSAKTIYDAKGTQAADGSLSLTLTAQDATVITVVGTTAADGSLSGTFTGPATDDAGSWTGTALVKPGAPMPPSPPASAASGVL